MIAGLVVLGAQVAGLGAVWRWTRPPEPTPKLTAEELNALRMQRSFDAFAESFGPALDQMGRAVSDFVDQMEPLIHNIAETLGNLTRKVGE